MRQRRPERGGLVSGLLPPALACSQPPQAAHPPPPSQLHIRLLPYTRLLQVVEHASQKHAGRHRLLGAQERGVQLHRALVDVGERGLGVLQEADLAACTGPSAGQGGKHAQRAAQWASPENRNADSEVAPVGGEASSQQAHRQKHHQSQRQGHASESLKGRTIKGIHQKLHVGVGWSDKKVACRGGTGTMP